MGIFGSNYGVNYDIVTDTTDPVISILTPDDLDNVNPTFTVNMSASDNVGLSAVEVQVDGGSWQTATSLIPTTPNSSDVRTNGYNGTGSILTKLPTSNPVSQYHVLGAIDAIRIGQDGNITEILIRKHDDTAGDANLGNILSATFDIWRQTSPGVSSWNRVHSVDVTTYMKTEEFNVWFVLPTPIPVQRGDFPGFSLTLSSAFVDGPATNGTERGIISSINSVAEDACYEVFNSDPGTSAVDWTSVGTASVRWPDIAYKTEDSPQVHFAGDSLTEGNTGFKTFSANVAQNYDTGFAPELTDLLSVTAVNYAQGGRTMSDIVTTDLTDIAQSDSHVYILMIGTNDVNPETSIESFHDDMETWIDAVIAQGGQPVIIGTPPLTGSTDSAALLRRQRNADTQALCTAKGCQYIDSDSILGKIRVSTGELDDLEDAYDSGDGIHLSVAGSTHLAEQVSAAFPNYTIELANLSSGNHVITARATDTSGNTATDSITVTVQGIESTPISHTTLDAGVDLRRRKNPRNTQVLTLSTEVPVTGKLSIPHSMKVECVGSSKIRQRLETDMHVPVMLKTPKIPVYVPVKLVQKTLFQAIGEKSYSFILTKTLKRQAKKDKIDTLKEVLQKLDGF